MLDGRSVSSAVYLLVAAGFSLVGIIHSPLPSGAIDLPWKVLAQVPTEYAEAVRYQTPYHWAAAYVLAAGLLVGLSLFSQTKPNGKGEKG
jgi:hypothetical protein